jgi:DNA-binding LytR/AlgR family response regulator
MTLTTYIIDDESHAIETLADYVGRTPGLILQGSSTDPVASVALLSGDNAPMLTFLDVDMPGISGLELANLVRHHTAIVFVTSYREFGPEAFELNAVDYLLKPISYARFLNCIQKVQKQLAGSGSLENDMDIIYVKGDLKGKYIRIKLWDILYIESSLHYIDIHVTGEKITTYLTLAELEAKLNPNKFCRVHRSFIVNLNRIKAVEQSQIRLDNKLIIPLGRSYRDIFFKRINPSLIASQKET